MTKLPNLPQILKDVLRQQFPKAILPEGDDLCVGAFPEWDSLGHFNFLMRVEERFDVRFSMEEMTELKGLKQIAAALTAHGVVA
jgi:acyl carrier protein